MRYVTVSTFIREAEKQSSIVKTKNVFDLTPEGQEAYFESLAKLSTDPAVLHNVGGCPIDCRKSVQPTLVNALEYQKRLKFVIENKTQNPLGPDRIEKLRIRVELLDTLIEFNGFIDFADKYGLVELGTISSEITRNFSISSNLKYPKGDVPVEVAGEFSRGSKITENLELKDRYIEVYGTLDNRSFDIVQEGHWQKDLNGIVDVTIKIKSKNSFVKDVVSFSKLFDEKGNPVDTTNFRISMQYVQYPQIDIPQRIRISYSYIYRDVTNAKGERTRPQNDDKVSIRQTENLVVVEDQIIITQKECEPKFWVIVDPRTENSLSANMGGLSIKVVRFESFEAAHSFLRWLKETQNVILPGNIKLLLDTTALVSDQISDLQIQLE